MQEILITIFLIILVMVLFLLYKHEMRIISLECDLECLSNQLKICDKHTWNVLKDHAKSIDDIVADIKQLAEKHNKLVDRL